MKVSRNTYIIYLCQFEDPISNLFLAEDSNTYIPIHKTIEEIFGKNTAYEVPGTNVTLRLEDDQLAGLESIKTVAYLGANGQVLEETFGIEWGAL